MGTTTFIMPEPAEASNSDYGNPNIAHQYVCTREWNFGANAEGRALNDIFNDGATSGIVWQPDVYHEAKKYAQAIGAKRIIDIGCGSALKLKSLFSAAEYEVIALDFAGSLIAAKENFPDATHIECDLTSWNEVLNVIDELKSNIPTVVVCADVIEHVPDPRPLLSLIRTLLSFSEGSHGFISTPDRSRLGYHSLTAKPANPAHIREWTTAELRNLLLASGFSLVKVGNIRANSFDEKNTTILIECCFEEDAYARVLARAGVHTNTSVNSVMLTTEYPQLITSGGIGTFVADWHRSKVGSAVLTSFEFSREAVCETDIIISPSNVIDRSRVGEIGDADTFLVMLNQLLFLCPGIREVHYQDYLGIGFRIAQAKSAGLLPDCLTVIAHCHGNQHYLENANQHWFGDDTASYSIKEKISIELADRVVFPSNFLKVFYDQSGIQVDPSRSITVPYRYTDISATNAAFEDVESIVFIGKFSPMKGFDLFCSAFDEPFCKELQAKGVKEIVLIGRGQLALENEVSIRNHFNLTIHTEFGHADLINFVRQHRANSLFVEPYRGDNFPLAVFDVVANGGLLVAGNAGGIPEMFRSPYWSECLMGLTKEAVKFKIRECIDWDSAKKQQISEALIEDISQTNEIVSSSRIPEAEVEEVRLLTATVMVPFYNTEISEVIELFKALNHQSLQPSEVIIVNDASIYKSRAELGVAAETYLNLPYRIIDHAVNCGLAGARNTALSACNTDLILNADSDDVPLNDWVKTIVIAMSRNPSAGAAVPYLRAFDAGTDFNSYVWLGDYVYRALGEGYINSQAQNCLGHANSGYSVSAARKIGGWDASNKAKYEDWAFYLNLLANGYKISIVPEITCLYRVRKNSMVRTYAEWPGQTRLFRTTGGLSRFETLQLQRLSRISPPPTGNVSLADVELKFSRLQELEAETTVKHLRIQELEQQLATQKGRKVVRAVDALADRLRPLPFIFPAARYTVRGVWKSISWLKRKIG